MGLLLENAGYNVNCLKIDPYLNIDAGMFNPIEHGETFVLSSGLETDQDMGNYERFLNKNLNSSDYLTSGMLYKEVIDKERSFYYKGKTVEAVPHITEAIRERIEASAKNSKADIQLIEIGGTLGDFQNELFIESARFMKLKNKENVSFVLVSYLPKPSALGEVKTRPTQHAIQLLNSYGINPDLIIARSEKELTGDKRKKIANSCGLDIQQIISAPDISNIYNTPVNFYKNGLNETLLKILKLKKIKVAIVGKYGFSNDGLLKDAYLSVSEAIKFSCAKNNLYPEIDYIYSGNFEKSKNNLSDFKKYNAVIIAGGFGENGIDGKINIMKYLRENNIPTLGICYGLQLMAVELCRNVLKKTMPIPQR
ncbi:MAG: CTP synthase [Candidatus Pacebacteria bacterium]|nr:CTP synthase [Candidatus Paceibacterota bacterium]